MATNPMQRKARNSFLLGVLVTLLIATLVIALLLIQLKNYKEKEAEEHANSVRVWVLGQNVISGQVITTDMLTEQVINKNLVPSNAIGDMTILSNYALTDKEGNDVITEYKNNVGTLYLYRNGSKEELKVENATGSYYIEKNGNREYVELSESPVIAKVDMYMNSIITLDMICKSDEKTTNDLRKMEYNMLVLPTQIETGKYVDIRLSLPSGQDYIVVSKKQVEIPQVNGVDSDDTIWLKLTEAEIITLNNAIVEAARIPATKLHVVEYVEAGMQEASTPTYIPTRDVMQSILDNPNIINEAKQTLRDRYERNNEQIRNNVINPLINNSGEEGESNLKEKIDQSVSNSKENRQEYLSSLSGEDY